MLTGKHEGMMTPDLEKAWKIVKKRKRWVGPHGVLPANVADAVAEGIALGRKEGLELASKLITDKIKEAHNAKRP